MFGSDILFYHMRRIRTVSVCTVGSLVPGYRHMTHWTGHRQCRQWTLSRSDRQSLNQRTLLASQYHSRPIDRLHTPLLCRSSFHFHDLIIRALGSAGPSLSRRPSPLPSPSSFSPKCRTSLPSLLPVFTVRAHGCDTYRSTPVTSSPGCFFFLYFLCVYCFMIHIVCHTTCQAKGHLRNSLQCLRGSRIPPWSSGRLLFISFHNPARGISLIFSSFWSERPLWHTNFDRNIRRQFVACCLWSNRLGVTFQLVRRPVTFSSAGTPLAVAAATPTEALKVATWRNVCLTGLK